MPAVNGVGEPCAGEPHARIDVAGAGNGASNLSMVTEVGQPPGKPGETRRPRDLPPGEATAPVPDPPYTCVREDEEWAVLAAAYHHLEADAGEAGRGQRPAQASPASAHPAAGALAGRRGARAPGLLRRARQHQRGEGLS